MPGSGLCKPLKSNRLLNSFEDHLCPADGQCRDVGSHSFVEHLPLVQTCVNTDLGASRRVVGTTDVQFAHLVLECCSFQPEALRRSALAGYSSRCGSQSIDNDLPLGLFET